jgi:hypothetical protein
MSILIPYELVVHHPLFYYLLIVVWQLVVTHMRMQHGASDNTQHEQPEKGIDLPSVSSAGLKATLTSGSDDHPPGNDGVRKMEESKRGQSDIDELNPHQQSTAIWPDPRAQTVEENDIFTVVGIPNLDPTTRVQASYESNHWSLHDPADPEQRFWLFGYDSGEPSTSSSSSKLFISMKASVIEYPVGRQLSEKEIRLTALNHSSGLTLLSVLEHRKKLQMKADPGLQGAATADFTDSNASPSGGKSAGLPSEIMDRPMNQPSVRPGPSSYWSVSEWLDFDKNIAHFGTDWHAIANHMGTKTHTMIRNQYLRLVEQGRADLEQAAREADRRRERGDYLGPPPTPTRAPKRRFMSTQTAVEMAEHASDTSNDTEGKPEPAQAMPQTDAALGSHEPMAEPPIELVDSTANNPPSSSHSVSSYTINAYIGQGNLEDLDVSLLTKAQLNLCSEYYALIQHGVNTRYNHAYVEWMHIRGKTVAIGQESNTLFLSATSMSDINIITKNIGRAGIPTVEDYDSDESDFGVVHQHVSDASSSKDDKKSDMNMGPKRTNPTAKADLEHRDKYANTARRISVGRGVDLTPDASLLEVKQIGENLELVPQVPDPFDAHGWETADDDFKRREEEMRTERMTAGVAEKEKELVAGLVATPRGILRPPTTTFREDPEPIREAVAPHKDSVRGTDVPVNARWTKIDRRLVNPEALEEAKERFEERMDCIIVLRVLTKEEIQKLADRTKEIRERRGTPTDIFVCSEQLLM